MRTSIIVGAVSFHDSLLDVVTRQASTTGIHKLRGLPNVCVNHVFPTIAGGAEAVLPDYHADHPRHKRGAFGRELNIRNRRGGYTRARVISGLNRARWTFKPLFFRGKPDLRMANELPTVMFGRVERAQSLIGEQGAFNC
jgi:hypothetical protein